MSILIYIYTYNINDPQKYVFNQNLISMFYQKFKIKKICERLSVKYIYSLW